MVALFYPSAALLLQIFGLAAAHGDGSHTDMASWTGSLLNQTANTAAATNTDDPWNLPSYSGLEAHSAYLVAHVAFMVAAWIFLLPIGTIRSACPSSTPTMS